MAFSLVMAAICLLLAGLSLVRARNRQSTPSWAMALFGIAFVMSFLAWVASGKSFPFTGLLQGTILLSVPLIFGALSGVLCERAGVVNIAIEGQLLAGAFLSAVVGSLTNSLLLGLIAAVVAGLLVAFILAVFAVKYFVDQVIVGVVINTLVLGLTSFFYTAVLTEDVETWNSPPVMQRIPIPILSDIPIIGPVLFNQSLIVYLMYVIAALVHIALFKTRWGLRVRAVGEHPKAADTVGIDVNRLRFRNVLIGGMISGLGGAFFTLGSVGAFGKNMTAGKGFIALAAMIFGRWSPLGAIGAAMLFGFADQLQQVLSIIGTPIPSQFMLMAPYLATLFAVAGLVGRSRAPAADGVPYIKS
jgi:simple sugar transport system permease protein